MIRGFFGRKIADESEAMSIALAAATDFVVDNTALAIDGTSAVVVGIDGRVVLIRTVGQTIETYICTKPAVRSLEQHKFGGRLEIDAVAEGWRNFRIDLSNRWEANDVAASLSVANSRISNA